MSCLNVVRSFAPHHNCLPRRWCQSKCPQQGKWPAQQTDGCVWELSAEARVVQGKGSMDCGVLALATAYCRLKALSEATGGESEDWRKIRLPSGDQGLQFREWLCHELTRTAADTHAPHWFFERERLLLGHFITGKTFKLDDPGA